MAYSSTETDYNDLYAQLQRDAPKRVVKDVSENWFPIKDDCGHGSHGKLWKFLEYNQ